MRAILIAFLAVAAIGLGAAPSAGAPGTAVRHNATPLTRLAGGYGYRPACPWNYRWYCRPGPYGYPLCACWPAF
jgi:hypothetical protein